MKKSILFMFGAAIALCLGGCGSKTESTLADAGAEGKLKNDKIVMGQPGDTPNLDTHNNLNGNGMRVNTVLYDPLLRMDSKTYETKPCLAETWEISEDGTEYVFQIKKGVKFSDGSDMTVDDVVFSLQRGMTKPMAVPSFARVKAVDKADDSHVKVTLDGPYPEFLVAMSLPTAGIFSKAVFEEKGEKEFFRNPVTTGPYMLSDWKIGELLTMEANENYHMGEAPIKHLEYRVITDPNSAILSLESGDIDTYIDIQQSNVKRIQENDKLDLLQGPTFGLSFIEINTSKPPFDKVEARQALCYAVDKESMLYGILDGNGLTMDTFVTDKYLGYTDQVVKYPYDPEKAKELLLKAGIDANEPITAILYSPQNSKYAQILQNSLSEIGFKLEISQMERSAFEAACLSGDANLIINSGTYTAPTVDETLYPTIHSSQLEVQNFSKYTDPLVDQYLEEARTALDETKRAEIYEKLLIKLSEDVPLIPTVSGYNNIAVKKGLKGVEVSPWSFYNVYEFSWE